MVAGWHSAVVSADVTSSTIVVEALPDGEQTRDALPLFDADSPNSAIACATGTYKPFDHREHPCRAGHGREIGLDTGFGAIDLTAFGTRTIWDSDGGYGQREEVVLLDPMGRAVHTVVQWTAEVTDSRTTTLRRRFREAQLDDDHGLEVCVESVSEIGPSLSMLLRTNRYRVSRRRVGFDAFVWNGTRLARAETLDGSCPRTGYRLFLALPLTQDLVHRSRGAV